MTPMALMVMLVVAGCGGVALQTAAVGVVWLTFLWRGLGGKGWTWSKEAWHLMAWLWAVLACITIGGLLKDGHVDLHETVGYMGLLGLPMIFPGVKDQYASIRWGTIDRVLTVSLLVVAGVTWTQWYWGWKLSDMAVVSCEFRGRGFTSHPLTLAYMVLCYWPYAAYRFCRAPGENVWGILRVIAAGVILLATLSRTVQVAAAGVLLVGLFWVVTGTVRKRVVWIILTLTVLILCGLPFRQRFQETVSLGQWDQTTTETADRVGFWRAHMAMFYDRPVFGHGWNVDREHYYKVVGLEHARHKYPAHQMFLQMLVDGGVAALMCFGLWWWALLQYARRLGRFGRRIVRGSVAGFLIAGMTQNAFQDYSVRYAVTVMVMVMLFIDKKFTDNDKIQEGG